MHYVIAIKAFCRQTKNSKRLITISRYAQRFLMQSDFNFDFTLSEFCNIKYINDIFNEGKHISFIWIY